MKNAAHVEGASIVRVDGQGLVGLLSPSLVVLPEHGNHRGGVMAERIQIVLSNRFFGEALGVFERLSRGIAPTVLVIKHIGKRETRVRGSVVRIDLEGSAETGRRFLEHLSISLVPPHELSTPEKDVVGVHVSWSAARNQRSFCFADRD